MSDDTSKRIPLLEEEIEVEKRSVDMGGVRITKHVHESEKSVEEVLQKERVSIERRPVNRRVEAAPSIRREHNTLIIPLLEEVLVVEKQLILKEEIHVTLEQTLEKNPQTVILRHEEATIERLAAQERKG